MTVLYIHGTRFMRTMSAAVNRSVLLDAMPDDVATAMRTGRRHGMYCALEGVEHVPLASQFDSESLVIVIPAHFAFHDRTLLHLERAAKRVPSTVV
jgi:hypothetical protein